MRRSLLLSLLCHATALTVAWNFAVSGPPDASPPRFFVTAPRELPPAERPLDVLAPAPPPAPAEAWPCEAPGEPAPVEYDDASEPPSEALRPVRLIRIVRLPSPLSRLRRRTAQAAPPPAAAASEATVPPAPARRKPPLRRTTRNGSSRGPLLKSRAGGTIVYPAIARRRGWEGSVTLRLRIGADGKVVAVEVARSSGRVCFDEAAARAAWRWQFEPALREGRPAEAWYERTVRFRLVAAGR